jgi:hypothetical protein
MNLKATNMNNKYQKPVFRHRYHLYILKRLLILANLAVVSAYIVLRIIFYDLPFSVEDELVQLWNIVSTASIAAVGVSFLLFAGDGITYLIKRRKYSATQPAVVQGKVKELVTLKETTPGNLIA